MHSQAVCGAKWDISDTKKTLTFLLVANNSSHNTTLLSFKQEFKKVIAILTEQNNYNAFVK